MFRSMKSLFRGSKKLNRKENRFFKSVRVGFESLEDRAVPASFTPGNLVVLQAGTGAAGQSTMQLYLNEYTTTPLDPIVQQQVVPGGTATSISATTWASNLVTVTTTTPTGVAPGQTVNIKGMTPSAYNGTYTVVTTPTPTSFTYSLTTNPGAATAFGNAISLKGQTSFTSNQPITIDNSQSPGNGLLVRSYDGSVLNFAALDALIDGPTSGKDTVAKGNADRVIALVGNQISVTNATWASNTATITTAYAHGISVGNFVTIDGISPSGFNGTFRVTAITSTTLSFALTSNPGSYLGGGTAQLFDTSTHGQLYVGDDMRTAVSIGSSGPIYAIGHPNQAGAFVTQGIHYYPGTGNSPSLGTQVSASDNIRGGTIGFDQRLYGTTASIKGPSVAGIFTMSGAALPTDANANPATDTVVVPSLITNSKLGGVYLADVNGDGITDNGDRLYFVDDGTVSAGVGGLYVSTWNDDNTFNSWNSSSGTYINHWSLPARLGDSPIPSASTTGNLRGVTGTVTDYANSSVQLYTNSFNNLSSTGTNSTYISGWLSDRDVISIGQISTSGTTVTVQLRAGQTLPANYTVGTQVQINGVGTAASDIRGANAINKNHSVTNYNGSFTITGIGANSFTYTNTNSGNVSGLATFTNVGSFVATVAPTTVQSLDTGASAIGTSNNSAVGFRGIDFAPVAATSISLGQSGVGTVTLTANVANPQIGSLVGSRVAFIDENTKTVIGYATVDAGNVATIPYTPVGNHFVSAYFAGGGTQALASAKSTVIQVLGTGTTASTTSLASNLPNAAIGKQITLTATVNAGATGTVSFYNGSVSIANLLGTSTISGTTAVLTTAFPTAGSYTLIAEYNGDNTYTSNQGSTIVNVASNAALTVTSSANNVAVGATPTYTVTINGNATLGDPSVSSSTVVFTIVSAVNNGTNAANPVGAPSVLATSSPIALTSGPNNTATATWSGTALTVPGSYFVTVRYVANGATNPYSSFATDTVSSNNGVAFIETAKQAFTPGNLVALQRGDGNVNLGSSGYLNFLVEYTPTGTLVQKIAMPNVDSGSSHGLLMSGQASGEGLISRSADNKYLTVFGYDVPVGKTFVTSTFPFQFGRTVARIANDGTLDTSTVISTSNSDPVPFEPIDAVSADGTQFWILSQLNSGNNTSSGIQYTGSVGGTSALQIGPSGNDGNSIQIAGGQLYIVTSSNISAVGTGTPKTPGQTLGSLPNFQIAYQAAYTNGNIFYQPNAVDALFLNTADGSSNNPNLIYVADQSNGLLKFWKDSDGNWQIGNFADQTFSQKPIFNGGATSVIGYINNPGTANASVQLYATGSNIQGINANQVVSFLDTNGAPRGNPLGSATNGVDNGFSSGLVSTRAFVGNFSTPGAPAGPNPNMNFAGLSFAPGYTTTTTLTTTNANLTYGYGSAPTITAAVTSTNGTPAGSVTFSIDGVVQSTVALSSGQAQLSLPLGYNVGAHQVTAAFVGDPVLYATSTATVTENVNYVAGDIVALQVGTANSSITLTDATVDPATSIATYTTSAAHNLKVGQQVVVSGSAVGFNGSYFVLSVPSATTFTVQSSTTSLAGQTSTSSISEVGNLVTANTTVAHGYITGESVTITGLGLYNGTYSITVVNPYSFTYTSATSGLAPTQGGKVTLDHATNGSIGGLGSAATAASIQNFTSGGTLVAGNAVNLATAGTTVDITGISEAGTTVTVTAPGHGFTAGQLVTITGAGIGTYNGTFKVTSTTASTFTFSAANSLNVGTISAASEVGNLVTITTSNLVPIAFRPGQSVTIAGVGPGYDGGPYTIVSAPTSSSFTYLSLSTGLAPASPSAGTATISSATGGTAVLASSGTITEVGSSTTEGALTRSLDQHSVTFGGYNQTPGYLTSNVTGLVGVLAPNGTVDTSTKVGAGDSGNFNIALRAVASTDGRGFYIASGNNVRYVALPTTGASIPLPFGITSISEDSKNVVTVTTDAAHGYSVGQRVSIQNVQVGGYTGTFTIVAVTGTTFKYNLPSTTKNLSTSSGGTATLLSTTSISDFYPNPSGVGISAGGQLYIDGGAGIQPNGVPPIDGPTPIGTGLPAAGGQGGLQLNGLPTTRDNTFGSFPSSLQFSFTPDGQTVFVADSRTNSLGGLYEYSFKGGTGVWALIKEYHPDTFQVTGLSEVGNLVTAFIPGSTNFTVGQSVVISGANVPGYNGTFTVASVNSNSLTFYAPEGLVPSGPAYVTAADGGFTSLSVSYSGNNAVIYATTNAASGNRILKFNDIGDDYINGPTPIPGNAAIGSFDSYVVVATAPDGTGYRGVSFTPTPAGTTATTTSLAISPTTANYGATVTLTATLSDPAATGWVSFRDATGKEIGSAPVTLVSGVAKAVLAEINNISAGAAQAITATYTGDSTFAPSTSTSVNVTINKQTPTSVITTSIPPTTTAGGVKYNVAPNTIFTLNSTLTVTPTSTQGSSVVYSTGVLPTGTVTFLDTTNGNQVVGIGGVEQFISTSVSTGITSISFVATILGSLSFVGNGSTFEDHIITATYSGDANFLAGTAATFTFRIANPTSVAVTTSNTNPGPNGTSVTLTATLTNPGGTPEGTVQFYDNYVPIGGPVTASGGSAFVTVTTNPTQTTSGTYALTPGLHSITALYVHDGVLSGALSDGSGVYEQAVQANAFNPNNLLIQRIGDGVNRLLGPVTTNTAYGSAIFVNEYAQDGTLVQSVALPTSDGPTSTFSAATANGTSTVTITTSSPHSFTTGQKVTISGLTKSAANGTFAITRTGASTFTYTASASITAGSIFAAASKGTSVVHALTAHGQQSAVGQINISPDGHYLYLTGYDSNPLVNKTVSVNNNAISRGVGQIDLTGSPGAVQTVAFVAGTGSGSVQTGGSITGVYTPNGDRVYVSGFNGVSYLPSFAAAVSANLAAGTTITSTTFTAQGLESDGTNLFVGALPYGSPAPRLVGAYSGTPTSAATINPLPGLPSTNTTQNFSTDVYLTHLDGPGAPAGINTMYLADDGNSSFLLGQISKWALINGTWTLVNNAYVQAQGTLGVDNQARTFFYLSGVTDSTTSGSSVVTLYSNYGNGGNGSDGFGARGPGYIYKIVDSNGYNATIGSGGTHSNAITQVAEIGAGTSQAATTTDETFRGVASIAKYATKTVLVGTPNPTTGGTLITYTATVSAGANDPAVASTGFVSFFDNGSLLTGGQNVAVVNGVAIFQTSLITAAGDHPITAAYSGYIPSRLAGSTSNTFTQTITAPTAPQFSSLVLNGGDMYTVDAFGQKPTALLGNNSIVEQLYVTFDIGVTLAPGAFRLDAGTVTQSIPSATPPVTSGTDVAGIIAEPDPSTLDSNGGYKGYRLRFDATVSPAHPNAANYVNIIDNTFAAGNISSTLKDGYYTLNTIGANVHAGNSVAGTAMAGNNVQGVWTLFGSVDSASHSATTNNSNDGSSFATIGQPDLDAMLATVGSSREFANPPYNANLDFDLSGDIGQVDLDAFIARFGSEWLF